MMFPSPLVPLSLAMHYMFHKIYEFDVAFAEKMRIRTIL